MSFNYSNIQATAQRLITKFGKDWVLKRTIKGTYNPSANTRSTDSTTNYTAKAVRTEYKNYQVDGEVIQRGDFKLLMEAKGLSVVPSVEDEIVDGSDTYQIINIKEIKPSTITIYYEIQVR
ncbi:hypothetical protein EKK58_10265 [Candidatus Dependentiae bacterium]|nr:MAG: hypothetical protein EKK58_10265 [Candidatus Dependentiae bacterium]